MRHLFMIDQINILTLDTTTIILAVVFGVAGLLMIGIGAYYFINQSLKGKKVKEKEEKIIFEHSDEKFIEALGGSENIISYELKGKSRLVLTLKDYSKLNKEELKKFYIDRFLEMSEKVILVGNNLSPLNDILNKTKTN